MNTKHRLFFGLALGVLLYGCVKLDDYAPTNAISAENAIHDLATAQSALNGVYDALQDDGIVTGFLLMTQVYTDEAYANDNWLYSWDNLIVCPDGGQYLPYRGFYNTINAANNLFEALQKIDASTIREEDRNNIESEALFIRSLCYFYLTNTFGSIPLVLTPTLEADASLNVSKSSQDDVYNKIVSDLLTAKENLLNESDTKRANINAVNALLARIHLYKGEYLDALTFSEELIGNGFNLKESYPDYLTDEIFFLEFSSDDGNGLATSYGYYEVGGAYEIIPSDEIIAAFDSNDMRKVACIAYDNLDPYIIKYNDFDQFFFGSDPSMQIRYAEVLLIAAEAAAELNDFTKANEYFNQVRQRAELQDTMLDSNNYIDLILHERFVELCFEGPHRWFDLKRRGVTKDYIEDYIDCNDFWEFPEYDLLINPNLTPNGTCNC